MKEFAKGFYKSDAWEFCRKSYSKSVGGLCEICLKEGKYIPGVIVHHLIPITPENIGDPEITLSWSNLQLLCRDHHADVHRMHPKRYSVDEFGRVTARS